MDEEFHSAGSLRHVFVDLAFASTELRRLTLGRLDPCLGTGVDELLILPCILCVGHT